MIGRQADRVRGASLMLALLAAVHADAVAEPVPVEPGAPAYSPQERVSGLIRIWGHTYMSSVAQRWARGFTRHHPDVRFDIQLHGSDTAMPALYAGLADVALLGRENNLTDDNGFGRVKQYKPLRLELMTGSLATSGKASALVVFVHPDNPLDALDVTRLGRIFGCDPTAVGGETIRNWGQLGLRGDWAARPINLYSYDASTNTGWYFIRAVLGGSRKMDWERISEFGDIRNRDGSTERAAQQSLHALRADRFGLAVSSLEFADRGVKALPLAAAAGERAYEPSAANVVARTYPLFRRTFAFVDVPPGRSMEPRVREFLRYALSAEGQRDVASDHGYLPLSEQVRREQLDLIR